MFLQKVPIIPPLFEKRIPVIPPFSRKRLPTNPESVHNLGMVPLCNDQGVDRYQLTSHGIVFAVLRGNYYENTKKGKFFSPK